MKKLLILLLVAVSLVGNAQMSQFYKRKIGENFELTSGTVVGFTVKITDTVPGGLWMQTTRNIPYGTSVRSAISQGWLVSTGGGGTGSTTWTDNGNQKQTSQRDTIVAPVWWGNYWTIDPLGLTSSYLRKLGGVYQWGMKASDGIYETGIGGDVNGPLSSVGLSVNLSTENRTVILDSTGLHNNNTAVNLGTPLYPWDTTYTDNLNIGGINTKKNVDALQIDGELQVTVIPIIPGTADSVIVYNRNTSTFSLMSVGTCTSYVTPSEMPFLRDAGSSTTRLQYIGDKVGIGTTAPLAQVHVAFTAWNTTRGLAISQSYNSTAGALLLGLKSGIAISNPIYTPYTSLLGGDTIMTILAKGYEGTNWVKSGAINMVSTGTIGNTRVPSYMSFATGTNTVPTILVEAMRITNTQKIGIGTAYPDSAVHILGAEKIGKINAITLDTNKGLRLTGTATVWEDLRIDALNTNGGISEPVLTNNFAGVSGIYQRFWQGSVADDQMLFNVQLAHAWKEGGGFEIHIHTFPWTTPSAGDTCVWEFSYNWQNVNGTYGAMTTNTVKQPLNGTAQWQHKLIELINLNAPAVGKTISSILVCRLRRLANSNASDTYTGGMGVLYVDGHYEVDSMGSKDETVK